MTGHEFQKDMTAAMRRMMAGAVVHGASVARAAYDFNVTESTIRKALQDNGISSITAKRRNGWTPAHERRADARANAKAVRMSVAELRAAVKENAKVARKAKLDAGRSRLADLYASGLTLEQIAAQDGVSRERIRQQIEAFKGARWINRTKKRLTAAREKARLAAKPKRVKMTPNDMACAFMREVVRHGDCWLSTRPPTVGGYIRGSMTAKGKWTTTTAHSVIFHAVTGTPQSSDHVDHICHNRSCMNPSHLQLLDPVSNLVKRVPGAFWRECLLRESLGLPVHPKTLAEAKERESRGFQRKAGAPLSLLPQTEGSKERSA